MDFAFLSGVLPRAQRTLACPIHSLPRFRPCSVLIRIRMPLLPNRTAGTSSTLTRTISLPFTRPTGRYHAKDARALTQETEESEWVCQIHRVRGYGRDSSEVRTDQGPGGRRAGTAGRTQGLALPGPRSSRPRSGRRSPRRLHGMAATSSKPSSAAAAFVSQHRPLRRPWQPREPRQRSPSRRAPLLTSGLGFITSRWVHLRTRPARVGLEDSNLGPCRIKEGRGNTLTSTNAGQTRFPAPQKYRRVPFGSVGSLTRC